mgnify:CR=1 FL=1
MENSAKGVAGDVIMLVITLVLAVIGLILLWIFHQQIYFVIIQLIESAIRGIRSMFGIP